MSVKRLFIKNESLGCDYSGIVAGDKCWFGLIVEKPGLDKIMTAKGLGK